MPVVEPWKSGGPSWAGGPFSSARLSNQIQSPPTKGLAHLADRAGFRNCTLDDQGNTNNCQTFAPNPVVFWLFRDCKPACKQAIVLCCAGAMFVQVCLEECGGVLRPIGMIPLEHGLGGDGYGSAVISSFFDCGKVVEVVYATLQMEPRKGAVSQSCATSDGLQQGFIHPSSKEDFAHSACVCGCSHAPCCRTGLTFTCTSWGSHA